jgi:hypothetical protein
VTGSSLGLGSGLDYATVKYNSNGMQQWASRYNGPANINDIAYAIAIDTGGNAYVTGSSLGSGVGLDYATVKYNCNGAQQWVARYNGPANHDDIAYAIGMDSLGNVYVTGSSFGPGSGLDYATIKYNCNGARKWVGRFNGPANGDDKANAIVIDSSNNVFVTGSSLGLGTGLDYATLKYNCNGARQWASRFNGPASGDDIADGLRSEMNHKFARWNQAIRKCEVAGL